MQRRGDSQRARCVARLDDQGRHRPDRPLRTSGYAITLRIERDAASRVLFGPASEVPASWTFKHFAAPWSCPVLYDTSLCGISRPRLAGPDLSLVVPTKIIFPRAECVNGGRIGHNGFSILGTRDSWAQCQLGPRGPSISVIHPL
jgi:hypothetical protein